MRLMNNIFSSPIDLLKKVEKDKAKLESALFFWNEDEVRESLFDFAVGSYHLIDWVKVYKPELQSKVYDLLNNNKYIAACRDLCNASKHVELEISEGAYKKHPPVVVPKSLRNPHPLVKLATDILEAQGTHPHLNIGSTDANIPLSQGLPAVCIGLTRGRGAHTTEEFIFTKYLQRGLDQLFEVVTKTFEDLK